MTPEEEEENLRIIQKEMLLFSIAYAGNDMSKVSPEYFLTPEEKAFRDKWITYSYTRGAYRFAVEEYGESSDKAIQIKAAIDKELASVREKETND